LGNEFEIVPTFWLIRLGAVNRDQGLADLVGRYPMQTLNAYARQDGFSQDVWPGN
jgi:hypothetical protein